MNSVADIWKIVLSRLSQDLSETTISTWFDEVEAVSIKDRTLYLHCPNDFKRSTIESMFSDRIKDSLRDIYSADFDVKLLSTAESTALFEPEVKKSTALLDSGEFTFDTFVVGESNKMAYAAARAVADGVGHYNPLFIYGDSGLGKTHLIYAIAHQIRTTRPSAKIIYIKGDDFINEFIELVRAGRGSEFRAKYRDADLLLVDDVQFVAGKEQVQNEFFHTFNTLYEAGRQIVLTSDRPPSDMHLLDDRLRTRFEWGLLVDVQPPDFETRLAIVKNKAAQWGTVIDDDIARYIAENVESHARRPVKVGTTGRNRHRAHLVQPAFLLFHARQQHDATLVSQRQQFEAALATQKQHFEAVTARVEAQLRSATEEMLRQREQEFAQSSKQNLGQIVDPLRETIDKMQKAIADNTLQQAHMGGSLKTTIEAMMRQSEATKVSTDELARVLAC